MKRRPSPSSPKRPRFLVLFGDLETGHPSQLHGRGTHHRNHDADPGREGVQIPTIGGAISFGIKVATKGGGLVVFAESVDGNARGQVKIEVVDKLDADGNGLPDFWEVAYWQTAGQDTAGDDDRDKLSNHTEYLHGTAPLAADTDKDGMTDG